jgi:hypothetical protein
MQPDCRIQAETLRRDSFSRSHDAVLRVYDEPGNVIDTHQHTGDVKEW